MVRVAHGHPWGCALIWSRTLQLPRCVMDGCYMWFETKTSRPTHYCKLVQDTKPCGYLASANKSRWKSRGWKKSLLPEPSCNVMIRCLSPGCKEVFWKRYLYKHISQKHANLKMIPTIVSRMQCTRIKEIMSRVYLTIREKRWLLSVKIMTRTHTTVIVHFNIHTHNKNEVVYIHESIFTWISIHIYIYYTAKW